jgi:hypothetical protein
MESVATGHETIQSCPGGGGTVPGGPGSPPPPGGGGGGTLEPSDSCNTDDPALDDPQVQAGLADLWARSGIDQPQQQRREQAAWIVRNPDGSYGLVPITAYAYQEPCRVNPADMNGPPNAVGWVHTHPFIRGEVMQICGPVKVEVSPGQWVNWVGPNGQHAYHSYRNEPSQPDRDFMYAVNSARKVLGRSYLQAYVVDSERITRYGANSDKDQPYGRCGY